jgi:hypothetical protein
MQFWIGVVLPFLYLIPGIFVARKHYTYSWHDRRRALIEHGYITELEKQQKQAESEVVYNVHEKRTKVCNERKDYDDYSPHFDLDGYCFERNSPTIEEKLAAEKGSLVSKSISVIFFWLPICVFLMLKIPVVFSREKLVNFITGGAEKDSERRQEVAQSIINWKASMDSNGLSDFDNKIVLESLQESYASI